MKSTSLVRSGRHLPHDDRTEAVTPETEVVAVILATKVVAVNLVTEVVAVNLVSEVVAENLVTAVLPVIPATAAVVANHATTVHVTVTGGDTTALTIPVVRIPDLRVVRVVTANEADIPIAVKNVPEATNIIGR